MREKGRDWAKWMRRAMPALDFGLVFVAFWLSYSLRYQSELVRNILPIEEAFFTSFDVFVPYALVFALWLVLTAPVAGLYREQRGRSWLEEVSRIVNGVASATVIAMAVSFFTQPPAFSRLLLILAAVLCVALLSSIRLVYRFVRSLLRRRGIGVERVLLIGAGDVGRAVLSAILARPDLGYVPIGYLDDDPERGSVDMGRVRGLGSLERLPELLAQGAADLVIVALPWDARKKIMEIVQRCEASGVQTRVVPDLFQLSMSQVRVENLEGIPLLGLKATTRMNRSQYLLKRAIDLAIVLLVAPLALPLGALIALAIKLDSPGGVFYAHRRVGKNGREFYMLKFRSMYEGADQKHHELIKQTGADPKRPKWENDPRITRVGRFLRRTSLDELPNLINVLRGEMSIVGPRPPTPSEVALYEAWQRQRLNTQPGITGLWQVSGRSKVPFEEQCLLDIYYIENWSIGLDLQILLRTIPNVLLGNGAY
jgi:exopolysaccharide biosynthesis polyprenyl glycosylphosphotransferase